MRNRSQLDLKNRSKNQRELIHKNQKRFKPSIKFTKEEWIKKVKPKDNKLHSMIALMKIHMIKTKLRNIWTN